MVEERRSLVSGNWKMHEDHLESVKLVQGIAALLSVKHLPPGREVSIHPPFTSLRSVQIALDECHVPLALGAQTCHYEDEGAFTGEVSAAMLKKLDVSYVITEHSERRTHEGETDALVRSKIDAILSHQMTPILCVGETLAVRDAGQAFEHVKRQVASALSGRSSDTVGSVVVAYEPLWAIGAGGDGERRRRRDDVPGDPRRDRASRRRKCCGLDPPPVRGFGDARDRRGIARGGERGRAAHRRSEPRRRPVRGDSTSDLLNIAMDSRPTLRTPANGNGAWCSSNDHRRRSPSRATCARLSFLLADEVVLEIRRNVPKPDAALPVVIPDHRDRCRRTGEESALVS